MRWKKISLVGVGLLGGSLGLALRQRGLVENVVGFVRRAASVEESLRLGVVDSATGDLFEAVSGAELVVLCTPIGQMRTLVEAMLPGLAAGVIITDVGSVKGSVVNGLESILANAGAHFIGSHPMAGSEKTGVASARADLFADAICLVTPTLKSNPGALEQVQQFWRSVGSRVLCLPPNAHDDLVSRSSHLPHVVAATLVNLVLNPEHPVEQPLLCANGFRDTTRIASGSPEMWRDIALANRLNLSQALDSFIDDLKSIQRALRDGDSGAIASFFEQAKQRRDQWSANANSRSPE